MKKIKEGLEKIVKYPEKNRNVKFVSADLALLEPKANAKVDPLKSFVVQKDLVWEPFSKDHKKPFVYKRTFKYNEEFWNKPTTSLVHKDSCSELSRKKKLNKDTILQNEIPFYGKSSVYRKSLYKKIQAKKALKSTVLKFDTFLDSIKSVEHTDFSSELSPQLCEGSTRQNKNLSMGVTSVYRKSLFKEIETKNLLEFNFPKFDAFNNFRNKSYGLSRLLPQRALVRKLKGTVYKRIKYTKSFYVPNARLAVNSMNFSAYKSSLRTKKIIRKHKFKSYVWQNKRKKFKSYNKAKNYSRNKSYSNSQNYSEENTKKFSNLSTNDAQMSILMKLASLAPKSPQKGTHNKQQNAQKQVTMKLASLFVPPISSQKGNHNNQQKSPQKDNYNKQQKFQMSKDNNNKQKPQKNSIKNNEKNK